MAMCHTFVGNLPKKEDANKAEEFCVALKQSSCDAIHEFTYYMGNL